jgi:uncharacterized phage-associated protein
VTLSACDVAAALRDRLPGLPTKKLHKLLYYCQGHHLAIFDEPLFSGTISAWDMGPVVGNLWHAEKQGEISTAHREMDEAQLNTVGYVVSRYGALTGQDLEHLTHSEDPWKLADSGRRPGESTRIKPEWIKHYFKTSGRAGNDEDNVVLDSAVVTRWLQGAEQRREAPGRPDSREEIVARLEALRARLTPRD